MSYGDYPLDEYGDDKIQDLTNNYEDQRNDLEKVKNHLVLTKKRLCIIVGFVAFIITSFLAFLAFAYWATQKNNARLDMIEDDLARIAARLTNNQDDQEQRLQNLEEKIGNTFVG